MFLVFCKPRDGGKGAEMESKGGGNDGPSSGMGGLIGMGSSNIGGKGSYGARDGGGGDTSNHQKHVVIGPKSRHRLGAFFFQV